MTFTITEPHPTVAANAYTHAGRGGLGNTFRAPVTTPAAGVPTALAKVPSGGAASARSAVSSQSTAATSTRFYAGRGGAGNAHPVSQRRSLSLDEEYAYVSAMDAATVSGGHVGRGGAGNVFAGLRKKKQQQQQQASSVARKGSDAASSASSASSSADGVVRSGFWARLRR